VRLNSKVKQNKLSLGITCELVKDPILMLLQGENYIIHSTHTDLCSQLECNNLISPQFNTSHSDVGTEHLNIIYELLNLNPCFFFGGGGGGGGGLGGGWGLFFFTIQCFPNYQNQFTV
jgi:hypothetical protein